MTVQQILDRNAIARASTHCQRGHEFTPDNIAWHHGRRWCRECKQRARRESYVRLKNARDGIVDEVAVERASRGDVSVYNNLTRQEHRTLVLLLVESEELPPIPNLRSAVNQERGRRRRGLVD